MSEFEKWFEKKKKYCMTIGQACYSSDYKEGWKAALEWILTELEIEEPFEIFYAQIKKELEQLNQSNSQSDNSPQSNTPG